VTGSNITRLSSLEAKTGSYATTGSNTFIGGQYLSSSFNPTGFSTTASLYTDGGLRVTKDAYISGTLYLNNVTVYGTQSVCYITSSQLNIASNLISVNTATPSVRFGGLAVYDSGSTGLTGSILWDSENNRWIYSNPSGSTYDGGMFISGPRNSSGLGSETGTTSCMLLAGQGGDHLTSSMIYHSSTVTCIPNALIGGTACFSGAVCGNSIDVGTLRYGDKTTNIGSLSYGTGYITLETNNATAISLVTNGQRRMTTSATGETCFACQVCMPATAIISGGGNTLTLKKGTGSSALAFAGNSDEASFLIEGISGGGMRWYTAPGCTIPNANWTSKFSIDGDGISTFSCQICLKERAYISGTFPGVMLDRTSTTAQSDIQWKDAGTSVWSIGTAVAAVGSNLDFYSYGLGNVLKLAPTGEACFRGNVCINTLTLGLNANNIFTRSNGSTYCRFLYAGANVHVLFPGGSTACGGALGMNNYEDTARLFNVYNNGTTCFFVNTVVPACGVKFGNGSTVLNYYEEGTFSATPISTSFNSATATFGRYTRIGNQITINVKWAVQPPSTGRYNIVFNIPFAFYNDNNISYTGAVSNYNSGTSAYSSNVGTSVRNSSSSLTQQYVEAVFTSNTNTDIHFSMTYFTF
jgi:hypothetical protein